MKGQGALFGDAEDGSAAVARWLELLCATISYQCTHDKGTTSSTYVTNGGGDKQSPFAKKICDVCTMADFAYLALNLL